MWIIVIGRFRYRGDDRKGTSFGAELGEQLLQFQTFLRRDGLRGTEAVLDLGDGILDHERILTWSGLRVTRELCRMYARKEVRLNPRDGLVGTGIERLKGWSRLRIWQVMQA